MRYDPMLIAFASLGWSSERGWNVFPGRFFEIGGDFLSTSGISQVILEVECANANWI